MEKSINYKGNRIVFSDIGTGKTIVFLHGYLESKEIWDGFAERFSLQNRVVCIDIPGHGKSDANSSIITVEFMAQTVNAILELLEIQKCILIGHSMGGYATLAFLDLFPEKLESFCLFHSHPYKDSELIINKRIREIELVKNGKKDIIASTSIPNAFANNNIDRFAASIELAKNIAARTDTKGIIACLKGMIERKDRSYLLKNTLIPYLVIAGKFDNYISYEYVVKKMLLSEHSSLNSLNHSGHMGFIEEPDKSELIIKKLLV